MCRTERVDEPYWAVCWKWIFPYPCKKYRTVTRWCCEFEWIKETRLFLFCILEGCAGGKRYRWYGFCFNLIGTATFYGVRMCFKSEKRPVGTC